MDSSDSSDDNGDTNNIRFINYGVPMLSRGAEVCLFVSKKSFELMKTSKLNKKHIS